VGLIEHAENGRRSSFHSAEELWAALAGNVRRRAELDAPPPVRAAGKYRPGETNVRPITLKVRSGRTK